MVPWLRQCPHMADSSKLCVWAIDIRGIILKLRLLILVFSALVNYFSRLDLDQMMSGNSL